MFTTKHCHYKKNFLSGFLRKSNFALLLKKIERGIREEEREDRRESKNIRDDRNTPYLYFLSQIWKHGYSTRNLKLFSHRATYSIQIY